MLTAKPRIPFGPILRHGWWPSFLKVILYRLKGYRIGRSVRFSFGAVLLGQDVEVGDGCRFGPCSVVRARAVRLGRRVAIGAMCFLDTPRIEVGDDTKFNEQVFIGGLQRPDSRFTIGRNSQVQQMCFINPAVAVTIGDDTSIGGHCLIFGHQSWHNVLDGYPADFRPITIGHNVGVAWRVFIGAGAVIGDGAMIGTNSLVNRTIPPRCLAMGSPAKVIAREPHFPQPVSAEKRAAIFAGIVNELSDYLRASGFTVQEADGLHVLTQPRRGWFRGPRTWRLRFVTAPDGATGAPADVVVSLPGLPSADRAACERTGAIWFDVTTRERADRESDVAGEVAMFLRRFGIRFVRAPAAMA